MTAFGHIPCCWLDVTRLLTRIGRGALTGIDRVELAYLKEAYETGCESYLCRTTRGYLRLDRRGALRLIEMAEGTVPLGPTDLFSKLTFRGKRPRHRAEAELRKFAVDRCGPKGLPAMIARGPTRGLTYLNVGHSNLSEVTLSAFAARDGARVMVMIHDLIPLTHPQYVVASQPEAFAGRINRVRRYASHVIANSAVTSADLTAHWAHDEIQPLKITAPLGVERRNPATAAREPGHFVMLGTIEPRKNHTLMLDVWEQLADEMPPEDMPQLHIIGSEGWNVEALMARITAHPLLGTAIFTHGPLSDAEVQDHFARASGFLFPSLAEGYGFPPLEAAMAGVVSICSDLPVFHETLGDCAVYVDSGDAYQWKETIKQHLNDTSDAPDLSRLKVPTWQEHFEIVADAIIPKAWWGRP